MIATFITDFIFYPFSLFERKFEKLLDGNRINPAPFSIFGQSSSAHQEVVVLFAIFGICLRDYEEFFFPAHLEINPLIKDSELKHQICQNIAMAIVLLLAFRLRISLCT